MSALPRSGDKFGRLTVVDRSDDRVRTEQGRQRHYPMFVVRCDCGTGTVVYWANLRRGLSTSCGCLKIENARKAKAANRTDRPSYEVAHARMRKARGAASDNPCWSCGRPAEQWAYDHGDPCELTTPYRRPSGTYGELVYSLDMTHYAPMCRKCHKALDYIARHVRKAGLGPRQLAEQAEHMRQAMPDPDAFEIVEDQD